jgi:ABC-type dipeptide/oligopeptide/nickel transport system permease component
LGATFLLINMSLDVIYRVIDPRLRPQNNGGRP